MVGRLMLILFSLVALPGVAMSGDGHALAVSKRVALVVGNGDYDDRGSVLANPVNDATAISAKLRDLRIEVIEAVDLDYKGMRDALRRFDRALQGADAGLFYYAGHAMEYRGRNYLFPTDAILETEGDVSLGLIDMDQVLQVMETAVPTRLVFLDACRNNPLARNFRQSLGASREASVGRGLARMQTAVGTFIAYATAPGDVAADGEDRNSPFTAAMLTHLDEPGLEISQMMQRVRNSVVEVTGEGQVPWDSSSLRGPFILNLNIIATPTSDTADRAETVFWETIKGSSRLADFEAYLERFGDKGVFAPLARSRVADLQNETLATEENALTMDRRQIQQALKALGYDMGAVDGIFGSRTRSALREWQQDNRYDATAYLSREQMIALLESASAAPAGVEEPASEAKSGADARLDDGTPVQLRVRLVKIRTDDLGDLGLRWNIADEANKLYVGFSADPLAEGIPLNPGAAPPSRRDIDRLIDDAEDKGRAIVLDIPLTVALGDERNEFFAGGEEPIVNASGQVVDYKKYGLHLEFTLTSNEANRIDIGFRPSIDWLAADGAVEANDELMPPALTTEVDVGLSSGQTAVLVGPNRQKNEFEPKLFHPIMRIHPFMEDLFAPDGEEENKWLLAILITPSF
ncbi:MAG: caspase family protein [Alphaproteobacteria bacterium]